MRIRAVRPDFWQDETIGHLPDSIRLFYIGLWCVSDDAGWFEWKPGQIGAALYPYRNPASRERSIEGWMQALVEAGRVVVHPCGCGRVPTLPKHQKLGGNPNYATKQKHMTHTSTDESVDVRSDKSLRGGKERVGEGQGGTGGWDEKITELRRRGEAS